jgi:hypothetical protein
MPSVTRDERSLPSKEIFDESLNKLSFGFEVETLGDELTVVIGGRWGRDHNRDYLRGLELILERLASIGAELTDAWVDSQYTRRHGLSRAACRLPIRGRRYPVKLETVNDFHEFRRDLLFRIGSVGLKPGDRGAHTPYKQIRLAVRIPAASTNELLAAFLAFGSARGPG